MSLFSFSLMGRVCPCPEHSLLALGFLDDTEVKINNLLGGGDNGTFIVRILKESATTLGHDTSLYEFKSYFHKDKKYLNSS